MTIGNTIELEIHLNLIVSGTLKINNIFRINLDNRIQETTSAGQMVHIIQVSVGTLDYWWFLLAPDIQENRTVKGSMYDGQ